LGVRVPPALLDTFDPEPKNVNRETKRLMQRQGQIEADGSPGQRRAAPPPAAARRRQRASIAQFLREVRDELRQVAWPNRSEMVNYTTIVVATLVLMASLIFLLNLGFGKLVLYMFHK
jgi:preprotein translocase subunit SecE